MNCVVIFKTSFFDERLAGFALNLFCVEGSEYQKPVWLALCPRCSSCVTKENRIHSRPHLFGLNCRDQGFYNYMCIKKRIWEVWTLKTKYRQLPITRENIDKVALFPDYLTSFLASEAAKRAIWNRSKDFLLPNSLYFSFSVACFELPITRTLLESTVQIIFVL